MEEIPLLKQDKSNPRKIPSAIFLTKVDDFLKRYNPQKVLAKLQESYR